MKKYLFLLFMCFATPIYIWAQQREIKGIVQDGETPLPSVSVVEKDVPNNGAVTGTDGRFQLKLKGSSNTLVVSSVGYLAQEVDVSGRQTVEIQLDVDAKGLDEVVVVGYGTQKKITTTGAISSISGKDIRQSPSASLQNSLMGRLPGFVAQQQSGQPGKDGSIFKIRGINTLSNDGTPLVIVDDIEYDGNISDIDPNEVENVSILKDAAATAIYGIKGANGVIVITTRHGQTGQPRISLKSETGLQTPAYRPQYLNAYQSATLYNQALENDGQQPHWSDEDLALFKNKQDPYGHPDINWWNTLMRPFSLQSRDNLTISGGSDKVNYFISIGYLWQDGLTRDFSSPALEANNQYYYKRYNFRSNLDIKATKTLSLNVDLTGNYTTLNQPYVKGRSNNIFFWLSDFTYLPPYAYPIHNPNGSWGANNSTLAPGAINVVGALSSLGYQRNYNNEMKVQFKARQELPFVTQGLSVQAVVAYDNLNSYSRNLTRESFPSYVYDPNTDSYTPYDPSVFTLPPLTLTYGPGAMDKIVNFQASINYDHHFHDHHVYALALTNQYSNSDGASIPENFRGYTFRTGYDYRQKYIVEINGAYNGTDRFQANKRYGFFPAASAGWNISEEPFFKNTFKFIDLFKLRGSYGLVGSDQIGGYHYIYEQVYNRSGSYSIGETHTNISGIVEGTLGNTNVQWEKEHSADIGADINMFKGRWKITADYFNRYRYDILITRQSVPVFTGISVPPVNLGRMRDRGFELNLTYQNNAGKFAYTLNANVSYAKNKILFMDEPLPAFPWLAQTGKPTGLSRGYISEGFYQSAADIASSPTTDIAVQPGDLKYKDVNGDGVIDVNDQVLLPYSNLPNTIYGFNADLSYKGFSIHFTLQAATNFTFRGAGAEIIPFAENLRKVHLDTWTPDHPNALLPRLALDWKTTVNDPYNRVSDFWLRRADYLRLKNVEIGYTFPNKWFKRLKLSDVRLYMNGYDLITWMLVQPNIYDIDPEANSGTDQMGYPLEKIYNFGLQMTF